MNQLRTLFVVIVLGLFIVLLTVGGGAGVEFVTNDSSTQPVADDPPESIASSEAGAKEMAQRVGEMGYTDTRVFIKQDMASSNATTATVIVQINAKSDSGEMLKEEFKQISMEYSDVVSKHPEMGGLTIEAGGVRALVSKDAAVAHSKDRLKDDAYWETVVITGKTK